MITCIFNTVQHTVRYKCIDLACTVLVHLFLKYMHATHLFGVSVDGVCFECCFSLQTPHTIPTTSSTVTAPTAIPPMNTPTKAAVLSFCVGVT